MILIFMKEIKYFNNLAVPCNCNFNANAVLTY